MSVLTVARFGNQVRMSSSRSTPRGSDDSRAPNGVLPSIHHPLPSLLKSSGANIVTSAQNCSTTKSLRKVSMSKSTSRAKRAPVASEASKAPLQKVAKGATGNPVTTLLRKHDRPHSSTLYNRRVVISSANLTKETVVRSAHLTEDFVDIQASSSSSPASSSPSVLSPTPQPESLSASLGLLSLVSPSPLPSSSSSSSSSAAAAAAAASLSAAVSASASASLLLAPRSPPNATVPQSTVDQVLTMMSQIHAELSTGSADRELHSVRGGRDTLLAAIDETTEVSAKVLNELVFCFCALRSTQLFLASVCVQLLHALCGNRMNLIYLVSTLESAWMPVLVTHLRALVAKDPNDLTDIAGDWESKKEEAEETRRFVENVLTLLVKVANAPCDVLQSPHHPLATWAVVEVLLEPPPLVNLPLGMRHTALMAVIVRVVPTYNDDCKWWLSSLLSTPRLLQNLAWWALEKEFLVGRHAIITSEAIEEIIGCIHQCAGRDVVKLTTATRAADQGRKADI